MKKDIIAISAINNRAFYRKGLISKHVLESRVQVYLKNNNMTFSDFLVEDTIRRISSRKNKKRIENAKVVGIVFLLIISLYSIGDIDRKTQIDSILAYNSK